MVVVETCRTCRTTGKHELLQTELDGGAGGGRVMCGHGKNENKERLTI